MNWTTTTLVVPALLLGVCLESNHSFFVRGPAAPREHSHEELRLPMETLDLTVPSISGNQIGRSFVRLAADLRAAR
jgi:hypothetical protein